MPGLLEKKAEEVPSPMEVSSGEEVSLEKEKSTNDAPASRSVVGIIYPPPEVRSIPPLC